MRKNYFTPEMQVSTFSAENVVTGSSGLVSKPSTEAAYNNASSKQETDFRNLAFTY